MKIYFIGIHNKPNMMPLDSRTVSGKTIDGIIAGLDGFECVKCNLFDTDKMPNGDEADKWKADFFDRIEVRRNDVAVLLGNVVHWQLRGYLDGHIIRIAHPSLQYSKVSRPDYISNAIKSIKEVIEKNLLYQSA